MTYLEQLKIELDRYETAHGTERRHPDGRLESRQMILLIGRAVLEHLTPADAPEPAWVDSDGYTWTRGPTPGVVQCTVKSMWAPSDRHLGVYRKACAALWPDFEIPE